MTRLIYMYLYWEAKLVPMGVSLYKLMQMSLCTKNQLITVILHNNDA